MKQLSLTAAHIARVQRPVEDEGLPPHLTPQTSEGYDAWVRRTIATHPAPELPTQLFAYGSLIWKPELEHTSEQFATVRGWHRSFCFWTPRFRGTRAFPGLMMALDRGGQCKGMLYELPTEALSKQLGKLFRREFTTDPPNSMPRWITVHTARGHLSALTFVMNRASPLYAGKLSLDQCADIIALACGHWGTSAEYLLNTVAHLESKGVHDRNLWRLQQLVAERIGLGEDIVSVNG